MFLSLCRQHDEFELNNVSVCGLELATATGVIFSANDEHIYLLLSSVLRAVGQRSPDRRFCTTDSMTMPVTTIIVVSATPQNLTQLAENVNDQYARNDPIDDDAASDGHCNSLSFQCTILILVLPFL